MSMYAMNANNLALSEYTGVSLTDLAVLDNRLYGVATDGLVEFTGTDDETVAIAAYVQTGKISLGSMDETRYARAYVKDQYANALSFTTILDSVDGEEAASESSYAYAIPAKTGAVQHARTVRLRRDVKAVNWAFKLANVSGGGMVLRGLEVEPEGIEVDV